MKFDLVTHRRNKKGFITETNPYRLYIKGNSWKYERPPGSGNMYSGGGELLEGPLKEEQDGVNAKAKAEKVALETLVADIKKEPATFPKVSEPVVPKDFSKKGK